MCRGGKLTIEEFIMRSDIIHNFKYNYSLFIYINNRTVGSIICDTHGQFKQTPKEHLRGKGCRKCANDKKSSKLNITKDELQNLFDKYLTIEEISNKINRSYNFIRRHCDKYGIQINRIHKLTREQWVVRCVVIHGLKYNYDEFVFNGLREKSTIICNACKEKKLKFKFEQTADNHLQGQGCKTCGYIRAGTNNKNKSNFEDFIKKVKKIHCDNNGDLIYDYSKFIYINARTKGIIICKKHGEFKVQPYSHLNGHVCRRCNRGKSSKLERQWLDSLSIPEQYRNYSLIFDDFWFNVDGFNPETNTVYEFNGDYWHGNPEVYNLDHINSHFKKSFKELYQKTIDKENLLKELGYKVISIWENDWNKICQKQYA